MLLHTLRVLRRAQRQEVGVGVHGAREQRGPREAGEDCQRKTPARWAKAHRESLAGGHHPREPPNGARGRGPQRPLRGRHGRVLTTLDEGEWEGGEDDDGDPSEDIWSFENAAGYS